MLLLLKEKENKMNWIIEENVDKSTIKALSKELNVDPVISSMLVNRGIKTFNQAKDFFRPNLGQLYDPFLMMDMDVAVNRILKAIEQKQSIMIFGDYDVDGTSSVALLSSYLKEIGADGVGVQNHPKLTKDFIDKIKSINKDVHVWTVNEGDEAKKYSMLGLSSITTNKPKHIKNCLSAS